MGTSWLSLLVLVVLVVVVAFFSDQEHSACASKLSITRSELELEADNMSECCMKKKRFRFAEIIDEPRSVVDDEIECDCGSVVATGQRPASSPIPMQMPADAPPTPAIDIAPFMQQSSDSSSGSPEAIQYQLQQPTEPPQIDPLEIERVQAQIFGTPTPTSPPSPSPPTPTLQPITTNMNSNFQLQNSIARKTDLKNRNKMADVGPDVSEQTNKLMQEHQVKRHLRGEEERRKSEMVLEEQSLKKTATLASNRLHLDVVTKEKSDLRRGEEQENKEEERSKEEMRRMRETFEMTQKREVEQATKVQEEQRIKRHSSSETQSKSHEEQRMKTVQMHQRAQTMEAIARRNDEQQTKRKLSGLDQNGIAV